MSPEQKDIFCSAMAVGVACGLSHRYECYFNYERMLGHLEYSKYDTNLKEAWEAFLAFEKTTAGSPEEDDELKELTVGKLQNKIANWYAEQRAAYEQQKR